MRDYSAGSSVNAAEVAFSSGTNAVVGSFTATGWTFSGGTTIFSSPPTLTIGSVHVGATLFTYQITNTGCTGPAVCGALQTGVNSGSVTDSRLSGTGVTAANFGPIVAGANSGDLAVTFERPRRGHCRHSLG